jgi:hypothetical protein
LRSAEVSSIDILVDDQEVVVGGTCRKDIVDLFDSLGSRLDLVGARGVGEPEIIIIVSRELFKLGNGHGGMMDGASYSEVENMTRGHESEKAIAEPASASALVRIWRRIADGVAGS